MASDDERGPKLGLEWEAVVYRGFRALLRGVAGRRVVKVSAGGVPLAPLERRLTIVVQVLTGEPVQIRPASAAGGVVGTSIYLPQIMDLAATIDANERLYVVRAAVGAGLYRLGPVSALPPRPLERAELETGLVERAVGRLTDELDNFRALWGWACRLALAALELRATKSSEEAAVRACYTALLQRGAEGQPSARSEEVAVVPPRFSPPAALWGSIMCTDPRLEERPQPKDAHAPARGSSERTVKTVETVERVDIDQKELEDATLQHSFEKVETADEYHGGARDLDGSDQLDEHAEAFEEIRFGKVTRSDEMVHAVLSAEVGASGDIPDVEHVEPGEQGIAYDEWDAGKRDYKRGFCTVYPTPVRALDLSWHKDPLHRHHLLIHELRRSILSRRMRRAPARRQTDGEWVDIDAVVHHLAAARAAECVAPRLYVRRARAKHDVATLVLLDVSLSSDSWVDDKRVLDVAREAVLVLGEVTSSLGDSIDVFAFASHTRNRCRVFEVSDRTTPWALARGRLGALAPQGYTRIGPALRHATAHLRTQEARHRVVLLVTDGKPTDYDKYEGSYGIADVRQAVREAQAAGVAVHGLTVDLRARRTFPAMLGQGRFHVLARVGDLTQALTAVYASLTD